MTGLLNKICARPLSDLRKKMKHCVNSRRSSVSDEAQRKQLFQQQQPTDAAMGQAKRQQSWYTKLIGKYELINLINRCGGGQ